jgi:hypothetical protein
MEEKILKASDLRFKPEEIKRAETERIPAEYIPVKLSSVGKLGAPEVIHVRDYTFQEALSLSEISENNETEVVVGILNSVIFEDFDAGLLHKNDVLEILMTIQGTWYSSKLEDMPYYINPDLDYSEINKIENIGRVDIPFSLLKTTPLKKEVSLPIRIKHMGKEVGFILPKVENEIIATKLIESKYAQEENELSEIKKKVEQKTQSYEEMKLYEKFLRKKTEDFLKINQALTLYSFNGKKLETLEEKLEVIPKLSLSLLKKYTEVIETHFKFGIDPTITFFSDEIKDNVTRRFDFRALHFLSSMEQTDDSGFDVSFG